MALYKLCRCGTKITMDLRCCDKCQAIYDAREKERFKASKRNREDVKEQAFYTSKPWITVRDKVRDRDNGLCLMCLYEKVITFYHTVHHIIEIKEDFSKALDPDNCLCLCDRHHKFVHREYLKSDEKKAEMQEKLRFLVKLGGGGA